MLVAGERYRRGTLVQKVDGKGWYRGREGYVGGMEGEGRRGGGWAFEGMREVGGMS